MMKDKSKLRRVTFNEITQKAVKAAFEHARDVDENLVDAQQTRRVLDRLVGYQVSPLLWDKVRRGLSAGRVQTVALRLIVEREQEINEFKPVEYWTIDAELDAGKGRQSFAAQLGRREWRAAARCRTERTRTARSSSLRMRCRTRRRSDEVVARAGAGEVARAFGGEEGAAAAIRALRTRPASCSRMLRGGWASTCAARWAWRSGCMKAWRLGTRARSV